MSDDLDELEAIADANQLSGNVGKIDGRQRAGRTNGAKAMAVARARAMAHQTKATLTGANLADPNRADKLLRRFSWEEPKG